MTNLREPVEYPGRGQVEFSPRTPHILEFINLDTNQKAFVTVNEMGIVEITEELAIELMQARGYILEGYDF